MKLTIEDINDMAEDQGFASDNPYPLKTTIKLARKYMKLLARLDAAKVVNKTNEEGIDRQAKLITALRALQQGDDDG
jgi:hypothetical protein